ncbi:hypothetical protein BDF19DRAFT_441983 [Syncephalis fuscata]|nr:hypothetical protein BDF19DRAFT_441983 [Syncephalis fuscata]
MQHYILYLVLTETLLISSILWASLVRLDNLGLASVANWFYVPKVLTGLTVVISSLLATRNKIWQSNYRKARDAGLALGALVVPLSLSVLAGSTVVFSTTRKDQLQDYLMALIEISSTYSIIFLFYMMAMFSIQYALAYIALPAISLFILIPTQQLLPYTYSRW